MDAKTTLVLGGTGKTGRRIVERMAARELPVRIASRSGALRFDWDDPATWPANLEQVGAAYVSYYPDLAAPVAAAAIRSFVELAARNGVRRLVLLSGRGEDEAQRCEAIVREGGAHWTILRCSWFSQNFSESYLLEPILSGEVALPAGPVGEPFVDADDIADVAVAALTDDRHAGQLYELTGPRLWTFADAVAEIARVTRRHIRYVEVSSADYASGLTSAQVPSNMVSLVTYLFSDVLDGRNAWVADGVVRALGRAPRDFSECVRHTAATGVWNVSGETRGDAAGAHSRPHPRTTT